MTSFPVSSISRLALTVVVAFTLVVAANGPASAATAGSWYFLEAVAGTAVPASTIFDASGGSTALNAADNTTLLGADLDSTRAHSIDFPGWQGVPAGGQVDPTASMLSSDPDFETQANGGSDGGGNQFDPGSAAFGVSVWLMPDDPADYNLPSGARPSSVSPNVAQKGRVGTPGGFWKVTLVMAKTSSGRRFYPGCEFKGGSADLRPGYSAGAGRYFIAPGSVLRVECLKDGATATMNVYTADSGSTPVFTRSRTAANPFSISNGDAVSVGHKPLSTDPADVYAGILDNLAISKG